MSIILGLNCNHADSSACLIKNGELVAAISEDYMQRMYPIPEGGVHVGVSTYQHSVTIRDRMLIPDFLEGSLTPLFMIKFIDNLFTSQDINYVFKPNNFPYAVDDNIIHYVLWIRPGLIINGTLLNTVIFRHIKLIFKPNPKYSFIKNSVSNKSIPQIEHYHVFISLDHSYNYKI